MLVGLSSSVSTNRARFVTAGAVDLCTYVPLVKSNSLISIQSVSWLGLAKTEHKKCKN
jgi:hypothetical protein